MKDPYSKHSSLAFDDILLVPLYSDIESRLSVDLTTRLTKNISLNAPIISTNMSTITEGEMMVEMDSVGGVGALHRFLTLERAINIFKDVSTRIKCKIASIGVKDDDKGWVDAFAALGPSSPDIILVDIAHGDSSSVVKMINWIKSNYSQFDVIAGNVATSTGYLRLCDAGADAVRVGIGGGSHCTTRQVTGHGMPTLGSVIDCAEMAQCYSMDTPIIADGGFKTSGDIVKALAFGADSVCLGKMLAGTSATPGDTITLPTGQFKEMYGMSSRVAQERHKGLKRGVAEEGIESLVPYRGATSDVLEQILGGIRSGLSYSGANNIQELRENFEYTILTAGSMKESKFTV